MCFWEFRDKTVRINFTSFWPDFCCFLILIPFPLLFFGLVGRPHILILGPMQWHSTVRGGKDSSEFVGRIKNCCNESADNKFCIKNDTEQNVFLSCKYVWLVGSMRFWMEILILQFFPSAECSSVPRLDNFFNFWMNCFRSAPADDPAPGKMQHNFNSVQIYISSTSFCGHISTCPTYWWI